MKKICINQTLIHIEYTIGEEYGIDKFFYCIHLS